MLILDPSPFLQPTYSQEHAIILGYSCLPAHFYAIGAGQYEQRERRVVVACDPYYKYSAIFHPEGLPPLCLLHGIDDELVPFSQSVQLAAELERRRHPHEFYTYEGLKHYFSTSADNATTQQMWQDALDCLRKSLTGD